MDRERLQEELSRTRHELLLFYQIGNLIRKTLLLDEVMYLLLSALTSHEGMGYNRAVLFLVDEAGTQLEGKMGIGPIRPETSPGVWKTIEDHKITLEGLLDVYHKAGKQIDPELNKIIRQLKIPIEKTFGVLANTVIHDQGYLIHGEEANHELCDIRLIDLSFSDFLCVPLRGKDQVIGALLVDNISTKKTLTADDLRRVTMLADHAGLALENAKSYSEVMITSQKDSLTKLWNHGHFQNLFREYLSQARISKRPLSIIIFDVDDFKGYNDSFGHPAGDHALEKISNAAKTMVRRMDYLARYGGEEFAAILPDTSKVEAIKLAERLRGIIERETAKKNDFAKPITVSIGVASYPEDAEDKDKLIFCADAALYEAKKHGKNQVRAYAKPGSIPLSVHKTKHARA